MEEEIRAEFKSSGFTIGGAGPRTQTPLLSPLFHLLRLVGTGQVADARGVRLGVIRSAHLLHQLQDEPRGSRLQLGGLLPQQVSPYQINRTSL